MNPLMWTLTIYRVREAVRHACQVPGKVATRIDWLRDGRYCPHPMWRRRCFHGQEILDRMGWVKLYRSHCLDCYRKFEELPEVCWVSGTPHNGSVTS